MDIYKEIVMKYRSELIKFCISHMNRGVEAAEDVVQEVFLTLYQKKEINFEDNIRSWLYETTKILIKKYIRKNPVHDNLEKAAEQPDMSQEIERESVIQRDRKPSTITTSLYMKIIQAAMKKAFMKKKPEPPKRC